MKKKKPFYNIYNRKTFYLKTFIYIIYCIKVLFKLISSFIYIYINMIFIIIIIIFFS